MSFSIATHLTEALLILFAEGPCKHAQQPQRILDIKFHPTCDCPIGFIPQDPNTNCTCHCDLRLVSITQSYCDALTRTIVRKGDFWITYFFFTTTNSSDYLMYSHCSLDYCKPASSMVKTNLNSPNGSDAQCAYNRQGTLCSTCKYLVLVYLLAAFNVSSVLATGQHSLKLQL